MKDLKNYLELEWRKSNHTKYQIYFNEWFKNLTKDQIYWFEKYMKRNYERF
jgi:hypothetical protein